MSDNSHRISTIVRLLQLSDSALPIGMFSFSSGVENGVGEGVIRDAASLERYLHDILERTLTSDCIVALAAYRATIDGDEPLLHRANHMALLTKLGDEQQRMSLRMGNKLAQLGAAITGDARLAAWAEAIAKGEVTPTLSATQGLLSATIGIDRRAMTASMLFGTCNMILGAALRLMRISHIETQRIIYRLSGGMEQQIERVVDADLDEICSFAPMAEILSSLHEKGNQRMFMS